MRARRTSRNRRQADGSPKPRIRMSVVCAIGVMALILAGCGGAAPAATTSAPSPTASAAEPTLDPATSEIKLMPIESVEVEIRESDPVQVAVRIDGSLADACTAFHALTQDRQGTVIEITLTTIRPTDRLCAQRITPYRTTVLIEGPFPSGQYRVLVNGVERTFTI